MNANTSSSNKESNPKRNVEVTKTFDELRLCSNHHPYGSLPVNSLSDGAQGKWGGLRVVVRRMQAGREKHSSRERSWVDRSEARRNLRIVFRKSIHQKNSKLEHAQKHGRTTREQTQGISGIPMHRCCKDTPCWRNTL